MFVRQLEAPREVAASIPGCSNAIVSLVTLLFYVFLLGGWSAGAAGVEPVVSVPPPLSSDLERLTLPQAEIFLLLAIASCARGKALSRARGRIDWQPPHGQIPACHSMKVR